MGRAVLGLSAPLYPYSWICISYDHKGVIGCMLIAREKILIVGVLVGVFGFIGSPGDALCQNTGPPQTFQEIVSEIELGFQVNGKAERVYDHLSPIDGRKFFERPLSSDLSYTVPSYGFGVALRGRGAKVAADLRFGNGVQSNQWVEFSNGEKALPFEPDILTWSVKGRYFVKDWIGVGVGYSSRSLDNEGVDEVSATIGGVSLGQSFFLNTLFSVRSQRRLFSVYVPLRKNVGFATLTGRLGGGFGTAEEIVNRGFSFFQDLQNPSDRSFEDGLRSIRDERRINVQFGEIGIEVPVLGMTARTIVGLRRVQVSDISTEWRPRLEAEVGIPF